MSRRSFCLICCLVALLAAPPQAWANARDKLSHVEAQLNKQEQQRHALEQKEREAAEGLSALRRKLIEATQALQTKEQEQNQLEDRLDELAQDIATKSNALAAEKKKLSELTLALIELSRQPPEAQLLQTGPTMDQIHRNLLLRSLLPRIREQTEAIARDLASLNALETQMTEQRRLVIAAQDNLRSQQHDLDQLIKTRQGLLQRTEAQKQAIASQLVSLSNEAKDLRQLLDKVTPKRGGKSKLSPSAPAILRAPVAGTLARNFGTPDSDGIISQGLTFLALPGSPIVAPLAGKVVFAGPFRGYGLILILQHEGGYHSFLAGFARIDADMGQEVETGEPLGVLPVKASSGNGRPELYFEWRHNNDPIDPRTTGITLSKTP